MLEQRPIDPIDTDDRGLGGISEPASEGGLRACEQGTAAAVGRVGSTFRARGLAVLPKGRPSKDGSLDQILFPYTKTRMA
jgi:hypothetical protein